MPASLRRPTSSGARTVIRKASFGGQIVNGPITYQVNGKQYVATISGLSLVAFALRE